MDFRYAFVFALLALLPLSSAASPDAVKGQGLSAAMDDVKCKDSFMISVMDSVSSALNVSFGSQVSSLQSDEGKLQAFADAGDVSGFRSFLKGTYDPDMKAARDAILDARKSGKDGSKGPARSAYGSLRQNYDSCHFNALKAHAQAKSQWYGSQLDSSEGKIGNLSSKGVETSGLNSIVGQAHSSVASQQNAINSATDAKGLRAALDGFCLYDGCAKGVNFHFAAKFEVEKLDRILSGLKADPKSANVTAQLDAASSDLTTASSILSSMGGAQGSVDQNTQLWSAIKDAAANIKKALSEMRK
jgi:hypothetical protein